MKRVQKVHLKKKSDLSISTVHVDEKEVDWVPLRLIKTMDQSRQWVLLNFKNKFGWWPRGSMADVSDSSNNFLKILDDEKEEWEYYIISCDVLMYYQIFNHSLRRTIHACAFKNFKVFYKLRRHHANSSTLHMYKLCTFSVRVRHCFRMNCRQCYPVNFVIRLSFTHKETFLIDS